MKRKAATSWRSGAMASCLAVAACAIAPPTSIAPSPAAMDRVRLAQRGHGSDAVFEVCRGHACAQRTPKTLAAAPAALVPETPAQAIGPAAPFRSTMGAAERPRPNPAFYQQLSVHFPFASARLDAAARATLREAAPRLAQADEIALSGRTDSTGPAAVNDNLAQARAQAVMRELVVLAPGMASRVRVDAQGACCFVESNDSPAGRARNRRVSIRYRFGTDDPP